MGQKLFRTREFPRSGSKAKDGERKKERLNDGNNNGQATHGARKHAKKLVFTYLCYFQQQKPLQNYTSTNHCFYYKDHYYKLVAGMNEII